MSKLLDKYRSYVSQSHAPHTTASYTGVVKKFILSCKSGNGEFVHPANITQRHIDAYLASIAHLSASTAHRHKAALQLLFEMLDTPQMFPRIRHVRRLPTVVSHSDIHKIIVRLTGEAKLAAMLCYGAGLTPQEVVNLAWDNVDFDNQDENNLYGRTIIPRACAAWLRAKKEAGDSPVNCTVFKLNGALKRTCKVLNVPPVTAATLRAGFIVWQIRDVQSLATVRKLAGFKSIQSVVHYDNLVHPTKNVVSPADEVN